MHVFEPTYRPFGDHSILMEWPKKIDENILKDIAIFKNKLKNSNIKYLVEINNTYNSLLITYISSIDNFYDAFIELKTVYTTNINQKKEIRKLWKIPVCYDLVFAKDLQVFSQEKNLSIEHIVSLHSSKIYTIFFIGFLPGFLYLGGLDKELHFPRKSTPNLGVEKGAVAIGGEQTGIYPQASPGGWHIIGNSPINFFDIRYDNPCFASAGDTLQFYKIDIATYNNIKALVDSGVYQLESEVIDD